MAKRNLRKFLFPIVVLTAFIFAFAQLSMTQPQPVPDIPPIEPGVSLELAKWRAARYSDVRYKLNLTLEKMSPVLKGTMEIRVKAYGDPVDPTKGRGMQYFHIAPIILDWRRIRGHEELSTISNVSVNGRKVEQGSRGTEAVKEFHGGETRFGEYYEYNEHLFFSYGVVAGENVIKLDFTSPILTSGSAITRYVDKEDGSEYIYSLFVPSDASTAFPVFDQPDLKARFKLIVRYPGEWLVVSNANEPKGDVLDRTDTSIVVRGSKQYPTDPKTSVYTKDFEETKPISTYVFAFAAGPFERVDAQGGNLSGSEGVSSTAGKNTLPTGRVSASDISTSIYVRKSQAAKFKPHAAEVFRLNREAVKYFEEYFDYKFPWPKYDLVLIPEFPFGGMEHAGATFLRESSIIFPQEPTKNDLVSRATLIFHEAAHQWFGDTVTMRWFDDLWLKEGFATFTAYKAMEKIMPEMNSWKVFYERIKQGAYQTDSTRGTTPIYQEIPNLSAAKSAYGNIVYNKAPAFLRQAEFYLGEDKFQTAVRAFLKKHEFGNAGWEDLVSEFESASKQNLKTWAKQWVTQPGVQLVRLSDVKGAGCFSYRLRATAQKGREPVVERFQVLISFPSGFRWTEDELFSGDNETSSCDLTFEPPSVVFPNYKDYGYGIFLLDEKSREYVLKNIQNEKDPFLRSMMWGSLWDSVREGELDPKEYVELVVKVLSPGLSRQPPEGGNPNEDESTTALLLNRVGTAMNYYLSNADRAKFAPRFEALLLELLFNALSSGAAITYYRAFVGNAQSDKGRAELKRILATQSIEPRKNSTDKYTGVHLRTKDRFDIVTRLLILGDPDAARLLADLEKTETSDDAKRYAYAARAGIATTENKAKYWNDFVSNKEISESWIEAAFGPWNSIRHSELTLPYLQRALQELPNHKRNRKIFFVNGWLGAFIGGQRSDEALNIVNKFLEDNPSLDRDLRLKILENADIIERAVRIRSKYRN